MTATCNEMRRDINVLIYDGRIVNPLTAAKKRRDRKHASVLPPASCERDVSGVGKAPRYTFSFDATGCGGRAYLTHLPMTPL